MSGRFRGCRWLKEEVRGGPGRLRLAAARGWLTAVAGFLSHAARARGKAGGCSCSPAPAALPWALRTLSQHSQLPTCHLEKKERREKERKERKRKKEKVVVGGINRCVEVYLQLNDLCWGQLRAHQLGATVSPKEIPHPCLRGCHPARFSTGPNMCTQRLILCLLPINYA